MNRKIPFLHRFTVRRRMALLLTITVVAVAVAFYAVQRSLNSQLDLLVRDRVSETDRMLGRVLELRASGASVHADDYTRWDDFVTFAKNPDPKWGQLYLTENIGTFGLDVAWVLNDRYNLIFTANPGADGALSPLPVDLPSLGTALGDRPIRHFFAGTPHGLLEIWTSSIQPSSDMTRSIPPVGYYIVGRLWTPARIAELSTMLGGTVSLEDGARGAVGASGSSETGEIRIALPLPDLHESRAAVLVYTTTFPLAPKVHDALHVVMLLLIAGSIVLFIAVSLFMTRWVAKPLAQIATSLRTENPSLLYRLMSRHDEFGHLARLVRDFFAQRESLIEARKVAEDAAKAKEQFLANISHELRTPMGGIISFSRFGESEAQTATREELLEYFRQIDESGTTLLELVDELLDLAKFEAGHMKLDLEEVTLDQAAQGAAGDFAALLRERQLALEIRIEPGLPPVMADRLKLRQVLRNLISNAAKFTPAGGQLILRAARAGDAVRLTVEDTGAGIPSDELEAVFDRFSQASNRKTGAGGTGLGLPLCREIVQAHGGKIWAERIAPSGTRMIVELPLRTPESGTGQPNSREAA